jgi:hypothetical protein
VKHQPFSEEARCEPTKKKSCTTRRNKQVNEKSKGGAIMQSKLLDRSCWRIAKPLHIGGSSLSLIDII